MHRALLRSLGICECQWRCRIGVDASVSGVRTGWIALRIRAVSSAQALALTAAEKEVVGLAAAGLSNAGVARQRGCAERTIMNQLNSAYAKLGISGRRKLRAFLDATSREAEPLRLEEPRAGAASGLRNRQLTCSNYPCLGEVMAAVLAGRLSLMDESWFDEERHVLARPNPPLSAARLALSVREREIVLLSSAGCSNKVAAFELGISGSAVSTYLTRARRKLKSTRAESLLAALSSHAAASDS
jgi:DNA-binding CsgD family transcriptional regulator